MTHASLELLEAMRGTEPRSREERFAIYGTASACGARVGWREFDFPWTEDGNDWPDSPVDCPTCIALYPPEIRVRMDAVESGEVERLKRGAA